MGNTTLDRAIFEKSELISYNQAELSNIADTSNYLRNIIRNQPDFNDSFLGGSYKRKTMVKGVSDVDVYYEYTGAGNPQSALYRLKNCLQTTYPNTPIKQDKPSILVDFNRIPFNITPYKRNSAGLSIPSADLLTWRQINFGLLEDKILSLRSRNSKLIDLIKILKLWNFNYNRNIENYKIEEYVCDVVFVGDSISDWLIQFYNQNRLQDDAGKVLQISRGYDSGIKSEWLKYIDKK